MIRGRASTSAAEDEPDALPLADVYARQIGQDPVRVRRWIAYMALGGCLERAGYYPDGPKFTIKGGVALELRLRTRARATRDLDLILNHAEADLIGELDSALKTSFEGFSFRRHGPALELPTGAIRVEVTTEYGGRGWARVQIDLGRREGDTTEFEMVEAPQFGDLCFGFPERLPCLSLYVQAAQKIHAMTLPPAEGRRNERFRDLVDLLLLKELITDLPAFRDVCERVFARRGVHAWPPFVQANEHWEMPFARMAADLALTITDLHTAVYQARTFLNAVDDRSQVFEKVEIPPDVTAATWYYLVDAQNRPVRLTLRQAEGLLAGDRRIAAGLPREWHRDPGGLVMVALVIILAGGRPAWLERVDVLPFAIESEVAEARADVVPEAWRALAVEVLRRSGADDRGRESLAVFLSTQHGNLPVLLARSLGVASRQAHAQHAAFFRQGETFPNAWDFQRAAVIEVVARRLAPPSNPAAAQDGLGVAVTGRAVAVDDRVA